MKIKLFVSAFLFLVSTAAMAVPAKRGIWENLRLADGTEVRAQFMGDEFMHFWETDDGRRYVEQPDGTFKPADIVPSGRRYAARRMQAARLGVRRVSMGDRTNYEGVKKGIVILMQFKDTKFQIGNNKEKYNDILNKEDYDESPFQGSVADYFKAQSGGVFELQFDVVGPYTATREYSYYGTNDENGYDLHPDEFVIEAVQAADSEVDFRDYDWDGDGEADQVFVVYAGKGEATSGVVNTIWPHMYMLSKTDMAIELDSTIIDTYACSNEIDRLGNIEGIGTFCHEFSHCLGYPDFYDTIYGGHFGMSSWDLMDSGSYNGNGFLPAGFSAYEKWMAGWLTPTELGQQGVTVKGLKAISEGGGAYVIYNDGHRDEYYILENRQKSGWDAGLPGKGMMITHVDFDKTIWEANMPNTIADEEQAELYELDATNDHQRFTIFHADNNLSKTTQSLSRDLYPYGNVNALTNTSTPSAKLYNMNTDGSYLMNKPVTDIMQNADGTISFNYNGGDELTPIADIVATESQQQGFYTLDGRYAGTDADRLAPGIYLKGGKKVIKR